MVKVLEATIIGNNELLPGFYRLVLHVPPVAAEAVPGQFVMIKTSGTLDPFLKRPLSINRIERGEGRIALIYQVVGRGTKLLSQMTAGEKVEIVGPLGRGFSWSESDKTVALIGGGCGIAPLLALAEELVKEKKTVYALLGAQTRDKLLSEEEFRQLDCNVQVATDDGSCGHKGFVTELLDNLMSKTRLDQVYCCGPQAMTRAVVKKTREEFIPCQVSLEERMGCGIGACIGCVCKVRTEEGELTYRKVCQDGPVFTSSEVVYDE